VTDEIFHIRKLAKHILNISFQNKPVPNMRIVKATVEDGDYRTKSNGGRNRDYDFLSVCVPKQLSQKN